MNSSVGRGLCAIVLGMMIIVGARAVEARLIRKVDNFIILQDQSGSMYMRMSDERRPNGSKMEMAKRLLLRMNELIPELGYKGGVYLFAPFEELQPPVVYDPKTFYRALSKIDESQSIVGRLTPMGPGIHNLDGVLGRLTGKTAVIVLSDGGANLGSDPVEEVRVLRKKYPRLCFHVISFADADDEKERLTLDLISGQGECVMARGPHLSRNLPALCRFIRKVLYDEVDDMPPPVREERIVLRGIHFDFDKTGIKPEWRPVLDEGVSILTDRPAVHVIIEGHTDSIGSEAYNERLSQRRAKAVHGYLSQKGISPDRMTIRGYGESGPIADNKSAEGRALNRRVELKILP